MSKPPFGSSESASGASVQVGWLAGRRLAVVALGAAHADEVLHALDAAIRSELDLDRAASRSGPALALSLFLAARRRGLEPPAFVLSAGDAVRRGVPTAARATITAKTPLRDELVEAQFGGGFAFAFARHLDALVAVGSSPAPVVIDIDGEGAIRVVAAPGRVGPGFASKTTDERAAALGADDRSRHVLTTGPAADAELPFASLASFDGEDPTSPPSLVGRGGLGRAVRGPGVVALTVESGLASGAEPGESEGAEAVRSQLLRSPRLLARAVGGTLELGALRGAPREIGDAPRTKHGCRGCPTPCGWRFDVDVGRGKGRAAGKGAGSVTGRFAALQGFMGRDDGLAIVERCNALGLDARAAAALFHGEAHGAEPLDFLEELVRSDTRAHRAGRALAEEPRLPKSAGAAFSSADLAARVGQALAARGREPVRSLSVFGLSGADPGELIAPFEWTGDEEVDAGTLARWHECFAAAIDVTGFCAFSAAGLVADGTASVAELDELLRPVPRPSSGSVESGWRVDLPAGFALLAAGAEHVDLHREWFDPASSERARELQRALPRAVASYRRARARGFGAPRSDSEGAAPRPAAGGARERVGEPGPHRLRIAAAGVLAERLADHPWCAADGAAGGGPGSALELAGDAPPSGFTAAELVARLADEHPRAAPWLIDPDGRPIPAVLVGGRRLLPADRIEAGSRVELVLAIPGG